MKSVTMSDVAIMARVSKSTVSQYINQRYDYMGEETKKRIEEAINVLGYQPNIIARSLKQKKTSTIGVIVANILHSFSTQVIRAIEDVCWESEFSVIVCNADDDPIKEKKYIETLLAKQVDGLIIFPTGDNKELYKTMEKKNYPVVFVDRYVEGLNISSILLNNYLASELAVNHLYEKGYRRIAMLTTSLKRNITPRIERLEGYKKALARRALPVKEHLFAGVAPEEMDRTLSMMFSQPELPDALLAGNDLTMLEVLKFVKKNGLSVPKDLALISIDEIPYSEIYEPGLTIVTQPAFDIGKSAGEHLLKQISLEQKLDAIHIRYSPSIIVRKST